MAEGERGKGLDFGHEEYQGHTIVSPVNSPPLPWLCDECRFHIRITRQFEMSLRNLTRFEWRLCRALTPPGAPAYQDIGGYRITACSLFESRRGTPPVTPPRWIPEEGA